MSEETRRDEADKNCEAIRRQFFAASRQSGKSAQTITAQAIRITELEAENARLRGVLDWYAAAGGERARAALAGQGDGE